MADSICLATNGAVPITRGTSAPSIPIVVPNKARESTATVGIKIMNGIDLNKLIILS